MDMLLSDHTKIRRRKLNRVNIKVTFIVWVTEFVGSMLLLLIPKLFGHSQVGTATGYIISTAFYFVILPFLYLVNDEDVKKRITDDSWFRAIKGIFNKTNKVEVLPH